MSATRVKESGTVAMWRLWGNGRERRDRGEGDGPSHMPENVNHVRIHEALARL